jgi:hypothetical protein
MRQATSYASTKKENKSRKRKDLEKTNHVLVAKKLSLVPTTIAEFPKVIHARIPDV